MDAIQSFFRKYDAVPATDRGAQWHLANDDALINWCASQCQAWDEQPEARQHLRPVLEQLRRETWQRSEKHEYPSGDRRKWNAAWYAICVRIGFGGDE